MTESVSRECTPALISLPFELRIAAGFFDHIRSRRICIRIPDFLSHRDASEGKPISLNTALFKFTSVPADDNYTATLTSTGIAEPSGVHHFGFKDHAQ